jgi:peptidylprolyl isomerase
VTHLHRAVVALTMALTVTACGADGSTEGSDVRQRIEVSGDFADRPDIEIDDPLEVQESTSWSPRPGEGDKVGEGATAIVQLTIADGRTGETVVSTLDQGQSPLEIDLSQQVFPSLAQGLVGRPAESRVVVASTSGDAYGENGAPQIGIEGGDSVVMVADVLSTDPTSVLDAPTGAVVRQPAGTPRLRERAGRPVGFDFAKARKPDELVVVPLREGTGPEVESPDRITAHYLGAVWGAEKPFDETYTTEPASFSIGLSSVVKAWDQGLEGVREGARVMLICPPDLAYGSRGQPGIPAGSTLVFVVDVLGVG